MSEFPIRMTVGGLVGQSVDLWSEDCGFDCST